MFAATATVLTACGSSPPPGRELADELIDTLDVSDDVKACMRDEVERFQLTDDELVGFEGLDDVAEKASNGQEQAEQIMQRFQDALASCNVPG